MYFKQPFNKMATNVADLRVQMPRWFLRFYALVSSASVAILLLVLTSLFRRGFTGMQIATVSFLFLFVILAVWLVPIMYSSIIVTNQGMKVYGMRGLKREFQWEDIARVSLPRFGIPRDFIYIFLKDEKKIIILKSMNNSRDFLQLILSKARDAKFSKDVITLTKP